MVFGVMTGVSAALCAAALALWVRSYWTCDAVEWSRTVRAGDERWLGSVEVIKSLHTWRGGLVYSTDNETWTREPGPGPHYTSWPASAAPHADQWEFLGFAYDFYGGGGKILTPQAEHVRVPFYAFVLLAATLPAAGLLRRRRRALQGATNFCAHCGYDLRATPNRCPECGMVAEA
jgi:hypothetical protein